MELSTDKQKAIDLAVSQIERQHGKGSIMRLDSDEVIPCRSRPDRLNSVRYCARGRWCSPRANC